MKRTVTYTYEEMPPISEDRGEWPRIFFEDFLAELKGVGFITGSALLNRMDEKERRDRVVIQNGPISGALTWQGELKALGHLMRRHGYPPQRSTGGVRGYRL